jgi:predicted ArsR family transcriptional regulator
MSLTPWRPGSLKGTQSQIVDLMRRSALTANEIASKLGLTHNAIRVHLASLQHAGLVRQGGFRRSGTRPAVVYELTPGADSVLSRAYIPFVAQLLVVLGEQMSKSKLDELMRTVGQRLAAESPRLHGDLQQRVEAASVLLNELGSLTDIEKRSRGFIIRGHGCMLAEAVHGRPEVCRAIESLLAELLKVPVLECCYRNEHPSCCFHALLQIPVQAWRLCC